MRLILENFRCHRNAIFEIPEEGLIQIAGKSGAGKTTILSAILYALFGKITKPTTHGNQSCTVTLEIDDCIIVRTSRPKRVTVSFNDYEVEGDEAESIILSQITGLSYDEFLASSCVVQGLEASVLSLPPSEQLRFIQNLALSNDKHISNRAKIKTELSELVKERTVNEGKISLLEEQTATLSMEDLSLNDIDVKKAQKELENLQEKMNVILSEIDEIEDEISNREKYHGLREQLVEIESKIDGKEEVDISELEAEKETLLKKRDALFKFNDFEKAEKTLEEIKAEHHKEVEREKKEIETHSGFLSKSDIETLEKRLAIDTKNEKYRNEIESIGRARKRVHKQFELLQEKGISVKSPPPKKKSNKAPNNSGEYFPIEKITELVISEISILKSDADEIRGEIETLKLEEQTYGCPGCKTRLRFEGGKLIKSTGKKPDGKTTISDLQRELRENIELTEFFQSSVSLLEKDKEMYNKKLPENLELRSVEEISCDEAKLATAMSLNERYDFLVRKSKKLPETFRKLISDYEYKKKVLPKTRPEGTLKECIEELTAVDSEINEAYEINSLFQLAKSISSKIPEELEEDNYDELIETNESLQEDLKQVQKKIKKYEGMKERIRVKTEMETLLRKKSSLEEKNKAIALDIKGFSELAEASRKAELLSVENVLENINTGAMYYLEQMFDDPIVIRIDNEMENAKGNIVNKTSVHIEYKGNVYDSVSQLSGGERQRANLAFLLAVNDMVNSRFLFLDESLNNLDTNLNTDILSLLKNSRSGKLTLVISHEAIEGIFNDRVYVGKE